MAFPGFIGAPVAELAALDVPWPGYEESYWREAAAGAEADVVVAPEAPVTARALLEGSARNEIAVDTSDCEALVTCYLILGSSWSVVLVDSLEAHPCLALPTGAPLGGGQVNSFFGADGGRVLLQAEIQDDDDQAIVSRLRTRPIAPAGAGGEALFTNLYLAIESWTSGWVRITPVVNGEVLTAEALEVPLVGDGSEVHVNRYEIPLTRSYDPGGGVASRAGIRGTWFSALIEARDCFGCGKAYLGGFELEYDVVTESLPKSTFALRDLVDVARLHPIRWFFGEEGGRILEGGVGSDDGGAAFEVRSESRHHAPAGAGGECLFHNLYLVVERANALDFTLEIVPIVDGEELETYELVLEGVAQPVQESHEIPLSVPYLVDGVELARNAPRGAWFAVRYQNGTAIPPEIQLWEGHELEYEVVSESEESV